MLIHLIPALIMSMTVKVAPVESFQSKSVHFHGWMLPSNLKALNMLWILWIIFLYYYPCPKIKEKLNQKGITQLS